MKTHKFFELLGILTLFLSGLSSLLSEISIEQKQHITLIVISIYLIAIYHKIKN